MSPIQIFIKDYKAVKSAEIDLKGITVISGVNGAGKSSISRLLYYALKYANNYDTIVNRLFVSELFQIDLLFQSATIGFRKKSVTDEINNCRRLIRETANNATKEAAYIKALELIRELLKNADSEEEPYTLRLTSIIEGSILHSGKKLGEGNYTSVDTVIKQVKDIFTKTEKLSVNRNYTLYRNAVEESTNERLNNVSIFEYGIPFIGRDVKSVPIPSYVQNAIYIDTPMIAGMNFENGSFQGVEYWRDLNAVLSRPAHKSYSHTVNNYIKKVIGGDAFVDFGLSSDGKIKYRREDGLEIDLADSATGIKSLSMLQALLRNGSITENTLLIIDEPEAHLHPQWIVEYARIIVMMHQKIGTKFFIASHSTDFVSAVKYIAEKQKVQKSLSFYLAEEDTRKQYSYNYKTLGTDIEPIFESFNKSLDKISEYGGW